MAHLFTFRMYGSPPSVNACMRNIVRFFSALVGRFCRVCVLEQKELMRVCALKHAAHGGGLAVVAALCTNY